MKNHILFVGEGANTYGRDTLDEVIRISDGRAIVIREATPADMEDTELDPYLYRVVVTGD
jgi:hypothetical protein